MNSPSENQPPKSYWCRMCGYVYDPRYGDLVHGVRSGTPFEAVPADWVCPICGARKDFFIARG
jgi:rubredoxin